MNCETFRNSGNYYIFDLPNISYLKNYIMKKALGLVTIMVLLIMNQQVTAQKLKANDKSEEIIIKKNGDKKMTIEINGDDVKVNGQPLSEFKDGDVRIRKLRLRDGGMNNFLLGEKEFERNNNIWKNSNNEKKAFLGVTSEKSDHGVKISSVGEGSAAEKAGLKDGDLITVAGGKNITDPASLSSAIGSFKPKEEIKIQYERNHKISETTAILGSSSHNLFRTFSFKNKGMDDAFKEFKLNDMLSGTWGNSMNFMHGPGSHRLGIRIEDLEDGEGAKITNVEENSVAEKAGLKKDDILTEIDGKRVKDVIETRNALKDLGDKSTYSISTKRNGIESRVNIKIPKRKNKAEL